GIPTERTAGRSGVWVDQQIKRTESGHPYRDGTDNTGGFEPPPSVLYSTVYLDHILLENRPRHRIVELHRLRTAMFMQFNDLIRSDRSHADSGSFRVGNIVRSARKRRSP